MSGSAAEMLERLADAEDIRHERFGHMLEALSKRLHEPIVSKWERALWESAFTRMEAIIPAPDKITPEYVGKHFDEIEHVIKSAYRRILFERDPHLEGAGKQIPKTKEDFDQLPDALEELRKRQRAV